MDLNVDKLPQLRIDEPAPEGTLRIVALGGIGEVGRNMTVFEYNSKLLIVDCGVLFPEESQPGVDLILPDFSYVLDRIQDVEALVLTHGHEDHIGAVPYLLRHNPQMRIVGSRLTVEFLKSKLREHGFESLNIQVVKEHDIVDYEPFNLEFIAVNHSIPDALALMIRTPAGKVLITGDFKMDQLPLDGRLTDLRAFANMGQEGVDLFMVDSTNAEVKGFTTHEREIAPVLESIFQNAKGQVIVASFASHVHRVQQVINAAEKFHKKVCFVGRSMNKNMEIARINGYLNIPDEILVDKNQILDYPQSSRVYMVTGSQGEPMAALSRIANKTHNFVSVTDKDTVVLASSLIPGNENSVFRVINALAAMGLTVVHQANSRVHVSGHASEGELLYCYNIVKPKNVMPIHGETRHLIANGNIAISSGVPAENVIYAPDGVIVHLKDSHARTVGKIPCEYVYVDGPSVGEIDEEDIAQRMILGHEGLITIMSVVDLQNKQLVVKPHLEFKGLAEDKNVFDNILVEITNKLQLAIEDGETDTHRLQQIMRRTLGGFLSKNLKRYPVIMPVIITI